MRVGGQSKLELIVNDHRLVSRNSSWHPIILVQSYRSCWTICKRSVAWKLFEGCKMFCGYTGKNKRNSVCFDAPERFWMGRICLEQNPRVTLIQVRGAMAATQSRAGPWLKLDRQVRWDWVEPRYMNENKWTCNAHAIVLWRPTQVDMTDCFVLLMYWIANGFVLTQFDNMTTATRVQHFQWAVNWPRQNFMIATAAVGWDQLWVTNCLVCLPVVEIVLVPKQKLTYLVGERQENDDFASPESHRLASRLNSSQFGLSYSISRLPKSFRGRRHCRRSCCRGSWKQNEF